MVEGSVIKIDKEKCIGCGICIKDCPNHVLELENGKAIMSREKCLECGHCVAICPKEAFSMDGYDMNEVKSYDKSTFGVDSDVLLNTIQFRRSIRKYKKDQVENEKIEKIIEAGRFTPTGSNKQNIRYVVVQESIPMFEDESIKTFKKIKSVLQIADKIIKLPYDLSKFELKRGFFFHGAPTLIFIISKDEVDASLATMSMELMAEAMGLGTLHVGFFTKAAKFNSKIRKEVGLKNGEKIVNCLAIGYPDVKYSRTVPRRKANIEWR